MTSVDLISSPTHAKPSWSITWTAASKQLQRLTEEERTVYTLRYSGAGHETYERTAWSSDTYPAQYTEDSLRTMAIMDGEEVICAAKDEAGNRIAGRVVVRGKRTKLMSFARIAEVMKITERMARRRYDQASMKLRSGVT